MSFKNTEQSLFISGEEQARLVLNSGLLRLSSRALGAEVDVHQHSPSPPPLRWRIEQHPKVTILAFVTSPTLNTQLLRQRGGGGDLVSFKKESFSLEALSSSLKALKKENSHAFDFLWSKGNPSFSFDKAAIILFSSCFDQLSDLKDQFLRVESEEIDGETNKRKKLLSAPLIVTGHAVGGSIASLFTLLLLDSISQPQDKLPICTTFGSPFLGDKGLQEAISQYSKWNSCFVHVVANKDPVLKIFVPQPNPQPFGTFGLFGSPSPTTITQQQHQPFGAYFLCSETGCTCVEDLVMVSEFLVTMASESIRNQILSQEFSMEQYGSLVQDLNSKVLVKGDPKLDSSVTQPLRAGIILQLEAIGDKRPPQKRQDIIRKLTEREIMLLQKKLAVNPLKKLNDVKINMAYLEWYKKKCKAKEVGYYDSYKNLYTFSDREVTRRKKFLNQYWKKWVEDNEKKPQKEPTYIIWLYAGVIYRRIVEPLDIAEHYRVKSNRDYVNCKRSRHYKLLEQWAKEEGLETTQPSGKRKKEHVDELLTKDSCFWAKVEDALVACKSYKESPNNDLQKQESEVHLINFDKYVMDEIDKYALSPEIFLEHSSFMRWWKEYEAIIGGYMSRLVDFMNNGMYNQYASGKYSPFD